MEGVSRELSRLPVALIRPANPGVHKCSHDIRRKDQVGNRKFIFYTGLGGHGYESMKLWLKRNANIYDPFVHRKNIIYWVWIVPSVAE